MLYRILITPIEYFIEAVFTVLNSFFYNCGYAIILVSVVVSTLVLPLYNRAEAIQEEERAQQNAMKRWVDHIRHSFHGDEQYMMLNAYYRETGYHPMYALKGALSLLLQIPFFIAAFHFLSTLQRIQGYSFWGIKDLGVEDSLIRIGGLTFNLLPVLMTMINLVSSAIYTRGFPTRQRIQPFFLAFLFLVILYHSPAGLVLYWTMNNVYSLAKNIVKKKVVAPKIFLSGILAGTSLLFIAYLIACGRVIDAVHRRDPEELLIYFVIAVLLFLPLLKYVWGKLIAKRQIEHRQIKDSKQDSVKVYLEEVALTILIGLVIPMSIISDSPLDFVMTDGNISPLHYAISTLSVTAGLFLIWGTVIYKLADSRGKELYGKVLFILLLVCLLNFYFYSADVGNISTMLEFDVPFPRYDRMVKAGNLLLIAIIVVIGSVLWKRKKTICFAISAILSLSLMIIVIKQTIDVRHELSDYAARASEDEKRREIPLSRNGRNVVVLMLDRAISAYIPFLFDEKPVLQEQFAGFTYYPNTIGYGLGTHMGVPAVYGGYEYTPSEMDERAEESITDKHNEAIKVMPVLFGEQGYDVTCIDVSYAGGSLIPDMSVYDEYAYVNAFRLEGIMPAGYDMTEYKTHRERNFVFYSLYKIVPAMLQDEVYDTGGYLAADRQYQYGTPAFRNSMIVLESLSQLSVIQEDATNTFLMMASNATHEPTLLALPGYDSYSFIDYKVEDVAVDRTVEGRTLHFDEEKFQSGLEHYQVNMAAMLALGRWFDWMRQEGVWDNTRIILVSDHGIDLHQFDFMMFDNGIDIQIVNPLLMVKDFNAQYFTTDWSYMTNGDVPILATDGLMQEVVNPFTGKVIDGESKRNGVDILWAHLEELDDVLENRFDTKGFRWYHVIGEDMFDESNWTEFTR